MLKIEEPRNKTFEELYIEALSQIPIYTDEWTNYNPSDPAITILENLAALVSLQGGKLNTVNYEARIRLLKMVGFMPKKARCSKVLLSAKSVEEPVRLMQGHRFTLGDIVYETPRKMTVGGNRLTAIYGYSGGKYHDFFYINNTEINVPAAVLGMSPKSGDAIYFISDSLPDNKDDIYFYFNIDETHRRNRVEGKGKNAFAAVKWECYTKKGFVEMPSRDYTDSFLFSGQVILHLPDEEPEIFDETPVKGYCLRAVLERAAYDIRPRFTGIYAFLFELVQKDTRSYSYIFNRTEKFNISSPLGDSGFPFIFGKEEKGSSYRRYLPTADPGMKGRFVFYKYDGDDTFELKFDAQTFGYAPDGRLKDAVRVIVYTEEIMRSYSIGTVLGYDDQELDLPVRNIVAESFCLIARRRDEKGEEIYDFLRPDKKDSGAFIYHLIESEGRIRIEDAGDFIGAELLMGSVAVMDGPKGNVRANNAFVSENEPLKGRSLVNICPGYGGCFKESYEELKGRFVRDMEKTYTAVTEKDYEDIVKSTPGLCIKKARAYYRQGENLVKIAVLPDDVNDKPVLSDIYKRMISERIEEHRLLTTRFVLEPPQIAAVSVRVTVYVKRRFEDCKADIERVIRQKTNYLESDRNFGDVLRFEEVFRAIEELPSVDYVYELMMKPDKAKLAHVRESDIYPEENVLLVTGEINLDTITQF